MLQVSPSEPQVDHVFSRLAEARASLVHRLADHAHVNDLPTDLANEDRFDLAVDGNLGWQALLLKLGRAAVIDEELNAKSEKTPSEAAVLVAQYMVSSWLNEGGDDAMGISAMEQAQQLRADALTRISSDVA